MEVNKKLVYFLTLFVLTNLIHAQSIQGNLSLLANQEIKLEGFNGLKNYTIAKSKLDDKGNFKLNYSLNDIGMGFLIAGDEKPYLLILSGEDIELKGTALSYPETVLILKGNENQLLTQYAKDHPKREQALSAWNYLDKMYQEEAIFTKNKRTKKRIIKEKKRIKNQDTDFLTNLPKDSYVSWFLPMRKLVSSVATVAQYRPEEITATVEAFRKLDYTDKPLYKSGLFKNAIESHFWLIENSGKSLDSVFISMKISIDHLLENLLRDDDKLNEVTDYLFDLLERHSLFQASEYLALKILNEVSCTVNEDLAKQLETYRAMKIGNTAPDIDFTSNLASITDTTQLNSEAANINNNTTKVIPPTKLSEIKSKYTLVVFGASWCPKCTEEIPIIVQKYAQWKKQDVEVVFISLDENKKTFEEFSAEFPFLSYCDYQKWDSKVVEDFYVFATPTLYLLDQTRKIILRPNSVKQMDTWVDWYLVNGNPMPEIK